MSLGFDPIGATCAPMEALGSDLRAAAHALRLMGRTAIDAFERDHDDPAERVAEVWRKFADVRRARFIAWMGRITADPRTGLASDWRVIGDVAMPA